jgi:hypothetical protein
MRFHCEMANTRWFVTPRDLGYATNVSIANQLVARWTSFEGRFWFDDRRSGGLTSEFAARSLSLAAVHEILKEETIPITSDKGEKKYRSNGLGKSAYLRPRRSSAKIKCFVSTHEGPHRD